MLWETLWRTLSQEPFRNELIAKGIYCRVQSHLLFNGINILLGLLSYGKHY